MKKILKSSHLNKVKKVLCLFMIICVAGLLTNYKIYHVWKKEICGFYQLKPSNLNQYMYINPNGTYMHIYKCDTSDYSVDTNNWMYYRNSGETRVEFEDFRTCLDDDNDVCISDLISGYQGESVVDRKNDKSCKEKVLNRGDWPSLAYKTLGGKVRLVLRINKNYYFEKHK